MAQASAAGKSGKNGKPKLSRADKKAVRVARRQSRRDTFTQMRQAFTMTRKNDAKLVPYLVLAFVVVAAVVYVALLFAFSSVWLPILPAILLGVLAALFLFSRRAQSSAYSQAEGQPGAAAYVLGQLRGDWHKTDAVAGTTQLDAVHRLLGRPGVVLIGEGAPHRVKPLLAQEKKRVARLAGDAPIYDIVIGRGEGEVPLGKLNTHLMKLPRNLSKEQVVALDRRLSALGAQRTPLPRGPMPAGVKMRSVQRAARRRG
ncbi:DUF4191 domain-containing protein [Jatrophihabitans lederbergiae]|uniref:DUF4191 domain-containing protein n=1 Tax=Jatrophihabitans lederbergiae TaxID=3075547 RepID=A0ABU2J8V3_9ACTN|nr:DUF4191 domain-containing protein [Jatrophihabitans sp. DSM 44399]MDT0261405.1 DUF4191 domain-containing protein [Jatrophihabitans sp. DSM 44399]